MSKPRVVILSVLDGRGRFGLAPETAAAQAAGAMVIPIATGHAQTDEDGDSITIRPLRPRLVAGALEEALEEHVDGMLVGLLPDYWQSRAISRVLSTALPETLVYAPYTTAFDARPFIGSYNRRLQVGSVLSEATVTVLPDEHAGALLGEPDLDADAAAERLVEAGSWAAWIRCQREDGRRVGLLRWNENRALVDVPPAREDAAPHTAPAILAAALGEGRGLEQAVELASRDSMGHYTPVHAAATA